MIEQGRLGAPEQNAERSSDSFVTVYLNSLPGLYAMLSQEKKHGLELNVRGWLLEERALDFSRRRTWGEVAKAYCKTYRKVLGGGSVVTRHPAG